ncbi:hypothetical protein LCGC14_1012020 [marine sediment metagenome]|uniref:ATPase dynein-related AAA domain-containing protein n=1 Tax=marine sediment metagenome TaxID=412755 RepID=A0A0F9N047_9ZZZZ
MTARLVLEKALETIDNIKHPAPREKASIAELFGLEGVPKNVITMRMADTSSPYIPLPDEHYVFSKEMVREVLAFLRKPDSDAMYVFGHTGTGKTSGINQILSKLNWPAQQLTCHEDLQFAELVGQFVMRSERPGEAPQMKWIYGPLAKAMRDGHALVLNEVDLVEPGELSGLNDVLDGRPLVISENGGEIIYPHPDFRVFVTGNSFGSGDERGVYQGVKVQNLAAMDRYRMLEVKYLAPEIEEKIIQNVAPDLPEVIVKGMVQSANEIRHVFMGQADQGSSGLDINTQLGVTMSTRVIRRWANLTMDFSKADNALQYALDIALLRRTQPEERVAISQICKSVFGEQWSVEATQ